MVTTATSSHVDENTNSNLHPVPGKMIDRGRAGKAVAMARKHEWAVILAGGDGTRLKSLACPGAARGFEGNRHPMERSREPNRVLASIQLASLRPPWMEDS